MPVCASVYNPWPYEHYTLGGSIEAHIAWYLFCPFLQFKHSILPPQKIRQDEKATDFSLRVQVRRTIHGRREAPICLGERSETGPPASPLFVRCKNCSFIGDSQGVVWPRSTSDLLLHSTIQTMTAAHLGLGVIKMNWKQKDRLSQALGFSNYNENYWSRRGERERVSKVASILPLYGNISLTPRTPPLFHATLYARHRINGRLSKGTLCKKRDP